jgi:dihydrofolate reductase
VARDPKAAPSNRDWAKKLEAKPKYVVSTTRSDFPWVNTHHIKGDLTRAVKALKKSTPRGLLVGSPKLSAALQRLDLVDEYRFVVHPVVAGHGPFLFSGLHIIAPEVRSRDTAQIGHRGAALSPALTAKGPTSWPTGCRDSRH